MQGMGGPDLTADLLEGVPERMRFVVICRQWWLRGSRSLIIVATDPCDTGCPPGARGVEVSNLRRGEIRDPLAQRSPKGLFLPPKIRLSELLQAQLARRSDRLTLETSPSGMKKPHLHAGWYRLCGRLKLPRW